MYLFLFTIQTVVVKILKIQKTLPKQGYTLWNNQRATEDCGVIILESNYEDGKKSSSLIFS